MLKGFTVKSLYNISHYNIDKDITLSCCGPNRKFYKGIIKENDHEWSFSYNSFVKLFPYNTIH